MSWKRQPGTSPSFSFRPCRRRRVVPDFMSQVAASMVAADAQTNRGRFGNVLKSAFVRHGILSLDTATAPTGAGITRGMALSTSAVAAAAPSGCAGPHSAWLPTSSWKSMPPGNRARFLARAASFGPGPAPAPDHQSAAEGYVADLFRRGRIHLAATGESRDGIANPIATKTHQLVGTDRTLRLARLRFDCGFDCARCSPGGHPLHRLTEPGALSYNGVRRNCKWLASNPEEKPARNGRGPRPSNLRRQSKGLSTQPRHQPGRRRRPSKAARISSGAFLTRGEAAALAPGGKLPPGATHEIVDKDEQGRPTKIVRRRFSIT